MHKSFPNHSLIIPQPFPNYSLVIPRCPTFVFCLLHFWSAVARLHLQAARKSSSNLWELKNPRSKWRF